MKDRVIAELFGKAAGCCSICGMSVFIEDVKIGEMAHIIAQSDDGPRGDADFPGDRDSYENLILLCRNHHGIVDGNKEAYTVERLHTIKNDHELRVRTNLAEHSNKHLDIAGLSALLRYLPFTQIPALVEFLPINFLPRIFEIQNAIEAFPIDNPHCRPFNDSKLEILYTSFVEGFDALYGELTASVNGISIYINPESASAELVLKMNPALPYQDKANAKTRIDAAGRKFLEAYYPLLNYLRSNFPEVNIASFR